MAALTAEREAGKDRHRENHGRTGRTARGAKRTAPRVHGGALRPERGAQGTHPAHLGASHPIGFIRNRHYMKRPCRFVSKCVGSVVVGDRPLCLSEASEPVRGPRACPYDPATTDCRHSGMRRNDGLRRTHRRGGPMCPPDWPKRRRGVGRTYMSDIYATRDFVFPLLGLWARFGRGIADGSGFGSSAWDAYMRPLQFGVELFPHSRLTPKATPTRSAR